MGVSSSERVRTAGSWESPFYSSASCTCDPILPFLSSSHYDFTMPRIRITPQPEIKLRPFISYYGGKYRAAPHYPHPIHETIIEPFAGSAGYAVRYPSRHVKLYDVNPKIVGTWQYLLRASEQEILDLPDIPEGQTVNDLNVCQEAKWLIGWWIHKGDASPKLSPTTWMRSGQSLGFYGQKIRQRIASQLHAIRHWTITLASYTDIPNEAATWFVDPPYNNKAGKEYPFNNIDYAHLADWCRTRNGQTIVCENEGATWLPFEPFMMAKSNPSKCGKGRSAEAIWTNRNYTEAIS